MRFLLVSIPAAIIFITSCGTSASLPGTTGTNTITAREGKSVETISPKSTENTGTGERPRTYVSPGNNSPKPNSGTTNQLPTAVE